MRLLHTSDWHVGKQIRNRSRMDEFEAVLDELVQIAVDHKVDAVLIAGDVFDSKVPPPEAEKLVYETLLRLHFEGIRVILTAGNHDNERRLQAVRGVLGALDITIICELNKDTFAELIEVPSRDGSEHALVAALPFIPEKYLISSADLMQEAGAKYSRYSDGIAAILRAVESHFKPDALNVLTAHFMVSGSRVGGGENELTIGMAYAVEPAALPKSGVQYLALGHVHKPQAIPGSLVPGEYSGSLLQLDFGEVEQDKRVIVVDGAPGKMVKAEPVTVTAGRRLIDVHDTLDGLKSRVGDFGDAYLRVFVSLDAPVSGLFDEVREILPNAVHVVGEYPQREAEETPDVRSLKPVEQFDLYFQKQKKTSPPEELVAAFNETWDEARLQEKVDASAPA
ncbi:MAG TPA: exonuclease SbcCD subunit D [Dehalococcoidia bacterium]|nr:exonuclease SbcCD subunit D [Dehalococcoidia bacterium]